MNSLIIVTTSPREASYLSKTLVRLDGAGANGADLKIVLADGCVTSDLPPGWVVKTTTEKNETPIGAKHSLWWALRFAVEQKCERLLFFEDDIAPCKNAVTRMLAQEFVPGSNFITFFCNGMDGMPDMRGGLYRCGMELFMCAQALLFPAFTLKWLASREPPGSPEFPHIGKNDRDTSLNQILRETTQASYDIHHPSLFDHVGGISSIYLEKITSGPTAPSFQGSDFDANSLRSYRDLVGHLVKK